MSDTIRKKDNRVFNFNAQFILEQLTIAHCHTPVS